MVLGHSATGEEQGGYWSLGILPADIESGLHRQQLRAQVWSRTTTWSALCLVLEEINILNIDQIVVDAYEAIQPWQRHEYMYLYLSVAHTIPKSADHHGVMVDIYAVQCNVSPVKSLVE